MIGLIQKQVYVLNPYANANYSGTQHCIFNGCLVALGVALALVTLLAGWFWWSMEHQNQPAVLDEKRYLVARDTISTITQHPEASFSGFPKAELKQLAFYLIRNIKILKHIVLNYHRPNELYESNMPLAFARFKKTTPS